MLPISATPSREQQDRELVACTSTVEVTKTFRFAASWFSDVRSYEWDLLVSEASGDLAYTVAPSSATPHRAPRPPARPRCGSPMCIGARTDRQWRAAHLDLNHPANRGDLTHTDGFTNA